jgi:hypothetical protein
MQRVRVNGCESASDLHKPDGLCDTATGPCQQVHAAWFDGRIAESVKQQLDDLALGRWLYFNASCCPCPQQYSVMVGKVMSCQKLLLRYTLPSGSVVSIEYDMSTPWTTYEAQISMVGGTFLAPKLAVDGLLIVNSINTGVDDGNPPTLEQGSEACYP